MRECVAFVWATKSGRNKGVVLGCRMAGFQCSSNELKMKPLVKGGGLFCLL